MAIKSTTIKVTTTGSAGSATGNTDSSYPIVGSILNVFLNFHASAPATTDVTIATKNAPVYNVLATTNTVTDALKAPRMGAVDAANAAITNSFVPIVVADVINIALAQSDALTDALVATILYDDHGSTIGR